MIPTLRRTAEEALHRGRDTGALQETAATASGFKNIAERMSGDAGSSLTIGRSSAVTPASSLASTHCQRPRTSSADLPAEAGQELRAFSEADVQFC